jgi:hypothetical protein
VALLQLPSALGQSAPLSVEFEPHPEQRDFWGGHSQRSSVIEFHPDRNACLEQTLSSSDEASHELDSNQNVSISNAQAIWKRSAVAVTIFRCNPVHSRPPHLVADSIQKRHTGMWFCTDRLVHTQTIRLSRRELSFSALLGLIRWTVPWFVTSVRKRLD